MRFFIKGKYAWRCHVLWESGAGKNSPTASAVVADVIEAAKYPRQSMMQLVRGKNGFRKTEKVSEKIVSLYA